MGKKDPRVDAYIAKSPDFARPLLTHLRRLIHAACPVIEETTKWRSPFFTHDGIVCGVAAFKQHCTLIFWNKEMRTALRNSVSPKRPGASSADSRASTTCPMTRLSSGSSVRRPG